MISAFEARWGETPQVFRASGRVNLIGEFTDYNDGFVMPSALAFGTSVAAAVRMDRWVEVYSENVAELFRFNLDEPDPHARSHWSDYVRGVAILLERAGHRLRGANLLIHSDVPMGAGLSSSAALEVAGAAAWMVRLRPACLAA